MNFFRRNAFEIKCIAFVVCAALCGLQLGKMVGPYMPAVFSSAPSANQKIAMLQEQIQQLEARYEVSERALAAQVLKTREAREAAVRAMVTADKLFTENVAARSK